MYDRLGLRRQQPASGLGQVLASVAAVVVARDLHSATVLGERLADGDRVGLGVDRECLPVGDPAADLGEPPLDPRLSAVVGGDRVGHPLALDQPHVPPV